jgi:hypothetical protein
MVFIQNKFLTKTRNTARRHIWNILEFFGRLWINLGSVKGILGIFSWLCTVPRKAAAPVAEMSWVGAGVRGKGVASGRWGGLVTSGRWQVPPSPSPGALRPRPRRLGDMIEWHWLNVEKWHGLACHSFVSPAPFVHHPHPALRVTLPPQGGGNPLARGVTSPPSLLRTLSYPCLPASLLLSR